MPTLDVHEMRAADAEYVGTCSHVGESEEVDASARRRLAYLEGVSAKGAQTLVASLDGSPSGFLSERYSYVPSNAPVTVDLFYTTFCLTSDVEAQRVREVAAEFGGDVCLREHCADDRAVRDRWGVSRAIYVDRREIGWGYEAPREGLREAFRAALSAL